MKALRTVGILFSLAVGNIPVALATDATLAPRQGIVLLTNGQLLEGTITASGDYYDMQVGTGQIRLRRSQVAHVAQSVRECYEYKRGEIRIERAQDHLDLADWCMQQRLFDEAAEEIAAARRSDPAHPKIPLLQTRLRLAQQAATAPKVAAETSTAAPPSGAKVNEIAGRDLSPSSMADFTQHIQPLLLNNCTGSGCHSAQSSTAMRLERLPINRFTGRKSTQRNLQSVLLQIDRSNPLASRLLTAPLEPHGGAKQPIFSDRQQVQYAQLVRWAYRVSGSTPPAVEPTLEERTAPLAEHGPQAAPALSAVGRPVEGQPVGAEQPSVVNVAPGNDPAMVRAQAAALADNGLAGAKSSATVGAPAGRTSGSLPASEYMPKDPFDPEIFNRLYHGR
jgi:hypothetical protein